MDPTALTPWTADDTQQWLSENALPEDFLWPHRDPKDGKPNLQPVLPNYRLTKGYGFWLRTTPYFPGLFEEIHQVLLGMGAKLPEDGAELGRTLTARLRLRGEQIALF